MLTDVVTRLERGWGRYETFEDRELELKARDDIGRDTEVDNTCLCGY